MLKKVKYIPFIVVSICTTNGRKNCLALANTGSSATLANEAILSECSKENEKKEVEWTTQGGNFNTKRIAMVTDLKLPQFTRNRSVEYKMHLFTKNKKKSLQFYFWERFPTDNWY